jgi:predicted CoA-binding protein
MTSRASVETFLAQNVLALAGVSRGGGGFGNTVLKDLTRKGYEILPIHPEADEVGGIPSSHSLAELPKKVGGLILVVPPEQTEKLVREAKEAGIERVWMQQGAESPEAIQFCAENGIDAVHGECIMMFAQPTGLHRFHHWLWGVFGKLPTADT